MLQVCTLFLTFILFILIKRKLTDIEISSQHIYANNYMNLDDVHTIGFDLDYTLVLYKGINELLLFL